MKDLYEILGLEKTATEADIKRAYRKLAAKYHPDVNKDKDATEKFKEIQGAYEILSDPQKKAQYDQFGSVGGGAGGGGSGFGGFNGFQGDFSGFDFSGGLGDIFETFFGGGMGGMGQRARKKSGKGRDLKTHIKITLEQAFAGTTKEIQLETMVQCETCEGKGHAKGSKFVECKKCQGTGQITQRRATPLGYMQTTSVCPDCQGRGQIPETPCSDCHGTGRVQKKQTIKLEIPAGIRDGMTLRVSQKGEAGERGAQSGDLLVNISIEQHKEYHREDDDIHTTKVIHITEAVLGTEKEINTLHGKTKLKIPAGTQPNQILRIKGKGMPHLNKTSYGDHYIHIEIEIPKKISSEERKYYEELAKTAKVETKNKGFFDGLF